MNKGSSMVNKDFLLRLVGVLGGWVEGGQVGDSGGRDSVGLCSDE